MSDDAVFGHALPDVVGLLAGDVGRDDAIAAGRHLRACRSCSEELIDVVIAHAALTSASRANRDLADWSGGADGDGAGAGASAPPASGPETGEHALPPPAVPSVRDEAPRAPRTRRRLALVMATAAAVIALGALGAVLVSRQPAAQPVVAQGLLQPLHAPRAASGNVTVLADGTTRHMIVRTRDLSTLPSQQFYEVWLLDPATLKMLSVGVLPPSGKGDYAVTAGIMSGYSAVDVSLQSDNGDPAHSQTSVLRASL